MEEELFKGFYVAPFLQAPRSHVHPRGFGFRLQTFPQTSQLDQALDHASQVGVLIQYNVKSLGKVLETQAPLGATTVGRGWSDGDRPAVGMRISRNSPSLIIIGSESCRCRSTRNLTDGCLVQAFVLFEKHTGVMLDEVIMLYRVDQSYTIAILSS